jgi:hypothetical protein
MFGVYFLLVLLSGQLDVSRETTSSELGERNAPEPTECDRHLRDAGWRACSRVSTASFRTS